MVLRILCTFFICLALLNSIYTLLFDTNGFQTNFLVCWSCYLPIVRSPPIFLSVCCQSVSFWHSFSKCRRAKKRVYGRKQCSISFNSSLRKRSTVMPLLCASFRWYARSSGRWRCTSSRYNTLGMKSSVIVRIGGLEGERYRGWQLHLARALVASSSRCLRAEEILRRGATTGIVDFWKLPIMTSRGFVYILAKMHKYFAFFFSSRETYYHQNRTIVGRKELRITGRRLEEAFRLPMPRNWRKLLWL